MSQWKKVPLGLVAISVIIFFMALATVFFWLARLSGKTYPRTIPLDPSLYNAFVVPDIVLSLLFFISAYGLLRLRKFGYTVSLVALGMWLFDSLLVLGITRLEQIRLVAPSLLFILAAIFYIWMKKELFE